MNVYLPAYTNCSDDGSHSGYHIPGPGFTTRQAAERWLAAYPNTTKRWGDGQTVIEVEVIEAEAPMQPVCGGCHYCCYGQA